jgi:hypothetical protein
MPLSKYFVPQTAALDEPATYAEQKEDGADWREQAVTVGATAAAVMVVAAIAVLMGMA